MIYFPEKQKRKKLKGDNLYLNDTLLNYYVMFKKYTLI